ncbi:5-(carboxyamino)imidazole ribonucleotide synthase [Ponticaulis sp.]|uniref:5-(carboxyamino)imidazole ribonucleotide synthase n=1 Tax=Ponticaulis sp. TaxID=2020902 RepID=UPI000C47A006|nr:5-(carboxyamino)imidazole ribonucleotide synthase [Ponticaulis sp.]MBN03008.1 5-(carboxyamino)imidazole ribonucleotide synthase [Ponticaulis sp.]|tara:strand:+ start:707 stop:1771 length:1065 start_codon:yes stop_codon:yes gene_type:complete
MTPLPVGSVIGILGDGQLGRMLASEAARLGFDVVVFGKDEDSPARRVASHSIVAEYTDRDALAELSVRCDLITLEFENVPVEALQILEDMGATVRPGQTSLKICQDRHLEKSFSRDAGVMTADYHVVNSVDEAITAFEALGGNGILKTRRDGYDGHGQRRLKPEDSPVQAFEDLREAPCVFEALVPFAGEMSVIVARRADGEMATFEPAENIHKNGILHISRAPSRYAEETKQAAIEAAKKLAEALGHVGVMACEFFVLESGEILLNEIAPRVHNSGHWTPEACITGQFEQHIRAIAGWPLGSTVRLMDVEMENLLGDDVMKAYGSAGPGDMITLYGKREMRAGRKMGHVVRKL